MTLYGWDGGVQGRPKREGIYVYLWLIHFVVQQKLTQYYKTIICQLKKKKRPPHAAQYGQKIKKKKKRERERSVS